MNDKLTQSNNCEELIIFLEKLSNKKYNQLSQNIASLEDDSATCALGWAASMGIGGLYFDKFKIAHKESSNVFTPIFTAEYVFGENAYNHVFAIWKPRENNESKMTEKQLAVNRLKQLSLSLKKNSKLKLVHR